MIVTVMTVSRLRVMWRMERSTRTVVSLTK